MKQFKVGVQLYSVRSEMEKDMYATLKAIKEMGYDYVEFAGYFGRTAEEVKAMLDELGLTCISVHQNPDLFVKEGKKAVDFLNVIGAKYCAIPWYTVQKYYDDFDGTLKMFGEVSDLLKEGGIRMTYHNHDFEFQKIDGEFILEKIYKTLGDKIEAEMDTCWVHYAGYFDPADFIRMHKDMGMRTLHLKDFVCDELGGGPVYDLIGTDGKTLPKKSKSENNFRFAPLGRGRQDFKKILDAAEDAGIEYVIVEQDQTYEQPCLEAVAESRKYLRETFGL